DKWKHYVVSGASPNYVCIPGVSRLRRTTPRPDRRDGGQRDRRAKARNCLRFERQRASVSRALEHKAEVISDLRRDAKLRADGNASEGLLPTSQHRHAVDELERAECRVISLDLDVIEVDAALRN